MASLKTIRQALADTVAGVSGLITYASVPDAANMPCVVVEPASPGIDYQMTYKSTNVDWSLALIVLSGRANLQASQESIDDYVSPDGALSIPAAIRADPTLGAVVDYAVCTTLTRYGRFRFGEVDYTGAQIDLEVRA